MTHLLRALFGRDGLVQLLGLARDGVRSRAGLLAENALLRQQLIALSPGTNIG